jgi:hypothetical protein
MQNSAPHAAYFWIGLPGNDLHLGAPAGSDIAGRATVELDVACGFPLGGVSLRSCAHRGADHRCNRNNSSDCHVVPPWLGPLAGTQVKQAGSLLRNRSGLPLALLPARVSRMSALPLKADIRRAIGISAEGQIADILTYQAHVEPRSRMELLESDCEPNQCPVRRSQSRSCMPEGLPLRQPLRNERRTFFIIAAVQKS